MEQYLIAHDLGTSGNKATLFTTGGVLVKSVSQNYPTHFFHGNWAEQNPEDWWQAFCRSNQQLLEGIDRSLVVGVAFSGQMMGCVVVDRNGAVLRPAMIWADQRAQAEEQQLRNAMDEQDFYHITGHKISASYSLEKLMWIRAHEPHIFEQTYKMLQAKDYIVYRLTGRFVTDYSDASGTNCLNLNTFCWSEEILRHAGISQTMLPELCASTDVIGTVPAALSEICGLAAGTKIILGGGDGVCAAVGTGAVRENIAYNYLGSSAWIAYASKTPVYDAQMRTYNWAHMVPGYVTPNGTMQAAGNSYQFLKEMLYECGDGRDLYAWMDRAVASSPIGANGLLYLPYLLGERSPRWNADARGAFVGMKMEHTKGDMLRAGLEGIFMNLCIILDIFREHAPIEQIRVIGGLAKGAPVPKMMADIYGIPVQRLRALDEATGMGAAVAAGIGAGVYDGFDAVEQFLAVEQTQESDAEAYAKYAVIKEAFEACYQALLPIYQKLKW